ncbi:TPM domain-containing protein [Bacillus sp. B1-b2]|uniref:TPM domain-containing protein n=1 Tax=Bacillus sp. B1-b2 TaxID=2653201 RepID=UPI00126195F3|nr:TPM domain-containing protein [Bacillus sp. B1-b2]KAB7672660.1 hypothetical protein F9279_03295 [Bacillus sp. B1-b2]
MRNWLKFIVISCLTIFILFIGISQSVKAVSDNQKQYIYDDAKLLTEEEKGELESLAIELGEESETAYLVLTSNGTDGKDIVQYVEDFYDENAPGYDQPFGNTAILAIDMESREIYLAGFKKAEEYLDDYTLDSIKEEITPELSDGNYFQAFSIFMEESHDYILAGPNTEDGYANSSNSTEGETENIFYNWIFQLVLAIVFASIVVILMVAQSGGKVTVSGNTYMDNRNSKILNRYDRFTHKTVTKVKKPENNNSGGGGGITGGGHSHSGSRGSF